MRFLVAILLISISYARRFLHVPYNEKDQVKSLGARFDWELKSWWYLEINFRIEDNVPTKPFAKWLNPAPPKVRVNLPRKAKVLKPIPPPILEADGTPYVEVTTAQLHQEPLRFGDNGPYFDQIEHENYKASYNRAKRSIDWVEEHLNKKIVDSHRGAKMHNEYLQDSQVYSSFRQVPEEYIETNSTYTMYFSCNLGFRMSLKKIL